MVLLAPCSIGLSGALCVVSGLLGLCSLHILYLHRAARGLYAAHTRTRALTLPLPLPLPLPLRLRLPLSLALSLTLSLTLSLSLTLTLTRYAAHLAMLHTMYNLFRGRKYNLLRTLTLALTLT